MRLSCNEDLYREDLSSVASRDPALLKGAEDV